VKLSHLVLSDIGPFRGTHIIDLNSDSLSSGYAFFGQNGRGKTSIYNAMKWCLWGEVRTRVRAVSGRRVEARKRPIVGDRPDILMNREAYENDARQEMSVILLAEGQKGRIQVSRTAKATSSLPRDDRDIEEILTVELGGETASDSEAQELIESFFPRELQQFFFIDGEALEEYTEMMEGDSISGMKDSVESVLRLPSVVRGKEDLESIRSKMASSLSASRKKSNSATKARNSAQKTAGEVRILQSDLSTIEKRLQTARGSVSKINEDISKHEEMKVYVDQLREAESQLAIAEEGLERSAKQRVKDGANAWKVLLWKKGASYYDEYDSEIDKSNQLGYEIKTLEKSIKERREDVRKMDELCKTCGQKIPDMEAYISDIKKKIEADRTELKRLKSGDIIPPDELMIKIGRMSNYKPQGGDLSRINESNLAWMEDRKRVLTLRERVDKLDGRVTSEAKTELGTLGEEKGRMEAKVREFEVARENAKSALFNKEMELRDLQAKAEVATDRNDMNAKLDFEVEKLLAAIDGTIAEYMVEARAEVEGYASEVFMEVTNAPATFKGISVDKDFRATIVLRSGRSVTAPSSGMKSMMTISIIDALRRVSRVDAPIFFDTPGRSLDEEHKQALLEYFWRDHGQQFLIFAHSGEFDVDSTIQEFGKRISRAYELKWPGDFTECMQCGDNQVDFSTRGIAVCLSNSCGHKWDTTSEHTVLSELEI